MHKREFDGRVITVQFAKSEGGREKDIYKSRREFNTDEYRIIVEDLDRRTEWKDLKVFN